MSLEMLQVCGKLADVNARAIGDEEDASECEVEEILKGDDTLGGDVVDGDSVVGDIRY